MQKQVSSPQASPVRSPATARKGRKRRFPAWQSPDRPTQSTTVTALPRWQRQVQTPTLFPNSKPANRHRRRRRTAQLCLKQSPATPLPGEPLCLRAMFMSTRNALQAAARRSGRSGARPVLPRRTPCPRRRSPGPPRPSTAQRPAVAREEATRGRARGATRWLRTRPWTAAQAAGTSPGQVGGGWTPSLTWRCWRGWKPMSEATWSRLGCPSLRCLRSAPLAGPCRHRGTDPGARGGPSPQALRTRTRTMLKRAEQASSQGARRPPHSATSLCPTRAAASGRARSGSAGSLCAWSWPTTATAATRKATRRRARTGVNPMAQKPADGGAGATTSAPSRLKR
mmetsp:Transcript_19606/g.75229  ORF Transcript_19606/g.75229 Transcript_19606/m.75229 type:complete len:340 (+) Transcript_19606:1275-2294(+)